MNVQVKSLLERAAFFFGISKLNKSEVKNRTPCFINEEHLRIADECVTIPKRFSGKEKPKAHHVRAHHSLNAKQAATRMRKRQGRKQSLVKMSHNKAKTKSPRRRFPKLWFFILLLALVLRWMKTAVGSVTFDEILFHLSMPLRGTDSTLFVSFLQHALLPAVVIYWAVRLLLSNRDRIRAKLPQKRAADGRARKYPPVIDAGRQFIQKQYPKLVIGVFALELVMLCGRLSMGAYLVNRLQSSPWLEENSVKPTDVLLTWPEKKRNLIYIYLESMETSFMDAQSGGFYAENIIPELTELARQNVSFSDKETALGGARPMTGTTWTMGAMFAQTSGFPLKIAGDVNAMDQYATFFPGVVTLGDLTEKAGYRNILMIGSDATFGGRRNYFTQHGHYEICDRQWAADNGKIPKDYWVFWGFEDARLIQMAKEKLLETAAEDAPFNFTLLTVDTHFPNGYRCEQCLKEHGNDYMDAISCSSRQIARFVEWIRQQDFYENTTVIVTGDHLSMAAQIEQETPADYQRTVYNCFLNAAAETANTQNRLFTTTDMFPTTLAALGVQIEGERLGLGTNLFGGRPTLAEEIGYDALEKNVSRHSRYFDSLAHE